MIKGRHSFLVIISQKMMRFFQLIIFLVFISSCSGDGKKNEAATYGNLEFGSDLGLQYIMESEASLFNYFYKNATISPKFNSENQLIEDFINNKIKLIVTFRDFNSKEKQLLKDRKVVPYTTIIGLEGLALVVGSNCKDTSISIQDLTKLISHSDSLSADISSKWKNIVFDGSGSSNQRFIDSLIGGKKLSARCFSKKSPQECIDFVAENDNSIGLVSFALLADKDDLRVRKNREKVKTLALSTDGKNFFRPSQRSFFNFDYPLIRKIYMHTREAEGSLAMGFISYVSSEEGQLVIKQGGLMPARLPWTDMKAVFEPMKIK